MLFSDMFYLLVFLPVVLVVYWLLPVAAQNVFLLAASLVFYAWGEPLFLVPMLLLILISHYYGRRLQGSDNPKYKKMMVKRAVILEVAVLFFVLYGDGFVGYLCGLVGLVPPVLNLPRPVGISFFTLQAMGYVFEISRNKAKGSRSIVRTGLFIAFMPTVIAGPILRYADLASQFAARRISLSALGLGFERMIVGLFKLLVLVTPLGHIATDIFNRSAAGNQFQTTPALLAWLGIIAFGLQFYLTLSGLADMAIGIARLFGFTLKENFNYPYAAHTVTEFWSRWNMTLYRWFYVYVFMLLGGNRAKMVRIRGVMRPRNYVLRNSLALWLLIGFWHGLGWNYLMFGMWFFTFFFAEWVVSLQRKNTSNPLWIGYVLVVVAVGWVLLRCRSFMDSMTYLSNMMGIAGNGLYSPFAEVLTRENWLFLLLGVLACLPLGKYGVEWLRRQTGGVGYIGAVVHLGIMAGMTYLCYIFADQAAGLSIFVR